MTEEFRLIVQASPLSCRIRNVLSNGFSVKNENSPYSYDYYHAHVNSWDEVYDILFNKKLRPTRRFGRKSKWELLQYLKSLGYNVPSDKKSLKKKIRCFQCHGSGYLHKIVTFTPTNGGEK